MRSESVFRKKRYKKKKNDEKKKEKTDKYLCFSISAKWNTRDKRRSISAVHNNSFVDMCVWVVSRYIWFPISTRKLLAYQYMELNDSLYVRLSGYHASSSGLEHLYVSIYAAAQRMLCMSFGPWPVGCCCGWRHNQQ